VPPVLLQEITYMNKNRASVSFSHDEIVLFDEILRVLLRGGDPRTMVRNPAFAGLMKKASTMRARIEHLKNGVEETAS
jgi:hypothetical protein